MRSNMQAPGRKLMTIDDHPSVYVVTNAQR